MEDNICLLCKKICKSARGLEVHMRYHKEDYLQNHVSKRIGVNNPFYGKKHSEETRKLQSEVKKGKPSYVRTEEIKKAESLRKMTNNPFKGKHHTKEYKQIKSNSLKGNRYSHEAKLRKNTKFYKKLEDLNISIESYYTMKSIVRLYTEWSYKTYKSIINPQNVARGTFKYHVDHKYSISKGLLTNVDFTILAHPCNLEMLPRIDNIKKHTNCSITLEELINNIKKFNIIYGEIEFPTLETIINEFSTIPKLQEEK